MLDQEVTLKIISTIDDLDRQFAQTSLLKMPFVKGSFKKRVLKILDDFRVTADQLLKLLYQQNKISVVRSSSCSSLIATGIDITPVRVLFFLDAIFNQKAALDPRNDVDRVKTPSIERLLFSQFFLFLSNMNGVSCSATLKQWAPGVAPLLESIIQLVSAERNRCVFTDPANYQFGFGPPSWLASSHNGMKLAESAMAYFAEEQRYADLNIQHVAE